MNAKLLHLAIRVRALHWLVIFLVILFAGFSMIFFPSMTQLAHLQAEIRKTEIMIQRIHEVTAQNKDMSAVVKKLQEESTWLERRLIRPGEHSRVISAVTEAAQENGVAILSIKPVEAQPQPGMGMMMPQPEVKKVKPVLFELKLRASYQTFGEFLEALKFFPLALTIESFEMAVQEKNPGSLKIQVIIAAFEEGE